MKICGLLGKGIQYSKSPKIHNSYYKENNIDFNYELFDLDEEQISNFIKDLKINNIIGFNVTIPYKQLIIKYLDELVYPADKIMAVNTVLVKENELIGYNTDYYGFIESLNYMNISVENKEILIIGNGGAAHSVFCALKDLKAKNIDIMCRDIKRAKEQFIGVDKYLFFKSTINYDKYDIIINCTPLGGAKYPSTSPINFKLDDKLNDLIVYDLNYIPKKPKILVDAEKNNAKIINGELMLKFQAYYAINIWNNKQ